MDDCLAYIAGLDLMEFVALGVIIGRTDRRVRSFGDTVGASCVQVVATGCVKTRVQGIEIFRRESIRGSNRVAGAGRYEKAFRASTDESRACPVAPNE